MPTRAFTIRKLADAAGVGVEAERYYQRCGLLHAPKRVDGGFRHYSDDGVRRLRFVRRAQSLGYSLEDVTDLMALSTTRYCQRVRDITRERVAEIRERMHDFQSMASTLENLADCCSKATEGWACSIIAALTTNKYADLSPVYARFVAQASGPRNHAFMRFRGQAGRRVDEVAA